MRRRYLFPIIAVLAAIAFSIGVNHYQNRLTERFIPSPLPVTAPEPAKQQPDDGQAAMATVSPSAEDTATPSTETEVLVGDSQWLRPFPYPYQAMFTIVSDTDGSTPERFDALHRWLNTSLYCKRLDSNGLDLDIADSFWVYGGTSDNAMSVFKGFDTKNPVNISRIKKYYDMGLIDSLHSFGDFSYPKDGEDDETWTTPTREMAETAIDTLESAGIYIPVFINHGNEGNKFNFGGWTKLGTMKYQAGDDPASSCYHTDLTLKYGVKFVWDSNGSDQYGYDFPLFEDDLRDGQKVWGFSRFTYYTEADGTYDWTWSPYNLYKILTKEHLDEIAEKGQYGIIANHFESDDLLAYAGCVESLKLLRKYQDAGIILTARTSRLLQYAVTRRYIQYRITIIGSTADVELLQVADPVLGAHQPTLDEVRGLTFLLPGCEHANILLDGKNLDEVTTGTTDDGTYYAMVNWYDPPEAEPDWPDES